MVSVDTVYQKVLAIANKEQRGYITPQEFNLFADHAQKDIFRQYFYDLERFERRVDEMSDLINDKISIFKIFSGAGDVTSLTSMGDFYKVLQVTKQFSGEYTGGVAQQIQYEDYHQIMSGNLTMATKTRPVFYIKDGQIHIHPKNTPDMENSIRYIRKPHPPNWTYVITGESAMFNSDVPGFMDFEIHESEETLLVIKILQLAGINIKDPALVQLASQEEVKKIQQEKQ